MVVLSPGIAAPNIMSDYASALEKAGHNVVLLDTRSFFDLESDNDKYAFLKKLKDRVKSFGPDFALGYNADTFIFMPEKGERIHVFENMKIPFVSLFYDSPMTPGFMDIISGQLDSDLYTVFLWDKYYLEQFSRQTGKRAHYLPLASNPDIFFPRSPDPSFQCDTGFIGSVSEVKDFDRHRRDKGWSLWLVELARQVVETRKINPATPMDVIFNAILESIPGDNRQLLVSYSHKPEFDTFWDSVNNEIGNFNRIGAIQSVPEPFTAFIYGNDAWKQIEKNNILYKGKINYHNQAPLVYASCAVNLNITSAQLADSVNQRIFDVSAAGGFLLTDNRPCLAELFEPDREMVAFESHEEMAEKLRFYLKHPLPRKKIAQRAHKRFLGQHTYSHRVEQIIFVLKENQLI